MLVNFESDKHLYNYCKKILRNNEIALGRDANVLLMCVTRDYFDMFYGIPIEDFGRLGIYHPISALIHRIDCIETEEELINNCNLIGSLLYSFVEIHKNKSANQDNERQYYIATEFSRNSYKGINGRKLSQTLIDLTNRLYQIGGIYSFHSENKKLLYVGKSINLGERIISSLSERNGVHYIKYFICKKCDMSILETYLIATLKPIYNRDCTCKEHPTIQISTPEFSDFIVAYEVIENKNFIQK